MKKFFLIIIASSLLILQSRAQCPTSCSGSNIFLGSNAGLNNAGGFNNTFLGPGSGRDNTTGNDNTFVGFRSGINNETGAFNTFLGVGSGFNNLTASGNTFLGALAGFENTTGIENTFVGQNAGNNNTIGLFNSFLGEESGFSNTIGTRNTFVGSEAGFSNTEGGFNTFIGRSTGRSNTTGVGNAFLGLSAGRNNQTGSSNTYLGRDAGLENITGSANVFIGFGAGRNEMGSNKLYISNDSSSNPLIYGEFDKGVVRINGDLEVTGNFPGGLVNVDGVNINANNAFVGQNAGPNNSLGFNNAFFGNGAGANNVFGSGNVFLGNNAGANENTSNKLFIDNSNTAKPLIYGDFAQNVVNVNGSLGVGIQNPERPIHLRATNAIFRIDRDRDDPGFAVVRYNQGFNNVWKSFYFYTRGFGPNNGKFIIADWGTSVAGPSNARFVIANNGNIGIGDFLFSNPSQKLTVSGNVLANNYFNFSDRRLKKNINVLAAPLERIGKIRGVGFDYIDKDAEKNNLPTGTSYGFIAQEVKKVFPELVVENEEGYLAVNYSGLIPVLVEALKKQQAEIKELREMMNQLTEKPESLSTQNLLSSEARLDQNQPNPSDQVTSIKMYVPEKSAGASLLIFDMQGNAIRNIKITSKGETQIEMDARELGAGMYLYSLLIDGKEVATRRMILY